MKINNFIAAAEIMSAEWLEVGEHEFWLKKEEESIEDKLVKKDKRDELSEEAKEIIALILKGGEEIVNDFGKICKGLITKVMRRKGYKYREIYNAMDELKVYVKTF